MVKQISFALFPGPGVFGGFTFRLRAVGSAHSSLHAAGNAERSAYGSKNSDNHLQDSFPNFLFHFLFPFFFLVVKQSVNISYGKSTPHALKGQKLLAQGGH